MKRCAAAMASASLAVGLLLVGCNSPVENQDTVAPAMVATYPQVVPDSTSLVVTVMLDEASVFYVVALPVGATAPSVDQIKLGQDATGTVIATGQAGSGTAAANTAAVFTATGLANLTAYTVYVVAEDDAGNLMETSAMASATTTKTIPQHIVATNPQIGLIVAGDDSMVVYVNGALVGAAGDGGTPHFYPVNFADGQNVIAAQVVNTFLGGSFLSYIGYPDTQYVTDELSGLVDTVVVYRKLGDIGTNSQWKYASTALSGWQQWGFADASWDNARVIAPMGGARQGGTSVKMATAGWDTTAAASFIFPQATTYYRKQFSSEAGVMTIKLSHNDKRIDSSELILYLDGSPVELKEFSPNSITRVCTLEVAAGTHVLAGELTDFTKGDGSKWILEAVVRGAAVDTIRTDSTWKVSYEADAGWNAAGFDDSQWLTAPMMGVDFAIKFDWGVWVNDNQFTNIWVRRDTTHEIFPIVLRYLDTLNYETFAMDTFQVDTLRDYDSLTITVYKSNARWVAPPENVYFRYEFLLDVQP